MLKIAKSRNYKKEFSMKHFLNLICVLVNQSFSHEKLGAICVVSSNVIARSDVALASSCLASTAQIGHLTLVKLELTSFLLGQEGQVKGHTDEVTLSSIVALIIVIIDDHVIAIVLSCRHILEVVQVEWIGQDVVRVDALQSLAGSLWSLLQRTELVLSEKGHVESSARILLLTLAPLAVFVVKRGPVVVDVLVKLNVADSECWEP